MPETLKEKLGYKHKFHITLQVSEEDQVDVTGEDDGEITLHQVTEAGSTSVRNSISFTPELFRELLDKGLSVVETAEKVRNENG